MNETLKVEQDYFAAIGINTDYVDDQEAEHDYLVGHNKQQMWSVVYSDTQITALVLRHEVIVEFHPKEVRAYHPDGIGTFCVRWGHEQWKSKRWAYGVAVVQAATNLMQQRK